MGATVLLLSKYPMLRGYHSHLVMPPMSRATLSCLATFELAVVAATYLSNRGRGDGHNDVVYMADVTIVDWAGIRPA